MRRFNKVTFYTFMPVMLFYNIYISDFSQAVRLPYVLFVVGMALGMVVVAFGVVLLAEKAPERRGVMIQAAFRSNFVLLGPAYRRGAAARRQSRRNGADNRHCGAVL